MLGTQPVSGPLKPTGFIVTDKFKTIRSELNPKETSLLNELLKLKKTASGGSRPAFRDARPLLNKAIMQVVDANKRDYVFSEKTSITDIIADETDKEKKAKVAVLAQIFRVVMGQDEHPSSIIETRNNPPTEDNGKHVLENANNNSRDLVAQARLKDKIDSQNSAIKKFYGFCTENGIDCKSFDYVKQNQGGSIKVGYLEILDPDGSGKSITCKNVTIRPETAEVEVDFLHSKEGNFRTQCLNLQTGKYHDKVDSPDRKKMRYENKPPITSHPGFSAGAGVGLDDFKIGTVTDYTKELSIEELESLIRNCNEIYNDDLFPKRWNPFNEHNEKIFKDYLTNPKPHAEKINKEISSTIATLREDLLEQFNVGGRIPFWGGRGANFWKDPKDNNDYEVKNSSPIFHTDPELAMRSFKVFIGPDINRG